MLEARNLDKQVSIKKIDNETVNIKIFDNKVLMAIVGEFNKNLNQIEKLTKTNIIALGGINKRNIKKLSLTYIGRSTIADSFSFKFSSNFLITGWFSSKRLNPLLCLVPPFLIIEDRL